MNHNDNEFTLDSGQVLAFGSYAISSEEAEKINIKLNLTKPQRIAARIINGLEVKYDKNIHIPMLIEVFDKGLDIAAFCSNAEISSRCFHLWVQKHKEFKEAYEIAREIAHAWWSNQAKMSLVMHQGASFDTKLWSIIMRNRFGHTEHRKVKVSSLLKAKTFSEQFQCIIKELSEGTITTKEAGELVGTIATGARIDEVTKLQDQVYMLEEALVSHK